MTRNRFVLLCVGVVVAAFALGLAWGLAAGGPSGRTPTGAPSTSASPATSSEGPGLPALYTGCRAQQVPVGQGWSCGSSVDGIDEVLVVRWPSAEALAADFAKTYQSKPDGTCGSYTGTPTSGYRSTWGGGQPLACYVNSNGAAVVMWEVPGKALQLLAIRRDGDAKAAFTWWTTAVKTPL